MYVCYVCNYHSAFSVPGFLLFIVWQSISIGEIQFVPHSSPFPLLITLDISPDGLFTDTFFFLTAISRNESFFYCFSQVVLLILINLKCFNCIIDSTATIHQWLVLLHWWPLSDYVLSKHFSTIVLLLKMNLL